MCPTPCVLPERMLKPTKVISLLAHPTDQWIPDVGRRGWILLSKDEKIRYRLAEKRAIAQAAVRAFFLVPKGLTGPENGRILASALERMRNFSIGNRPPFIAKVFRNGTVKMWERPRP